MPDSLHQSEPEGATWADPGYFANQSPLANTGRVLVQLIRPPKGHRTLPTRSGSMLILISLGIGTAAFNTAHNILYIALSLLLSSLLLSGVMSWFNFKGCRWRLLAESHFRVNEPTPITIEVSNDKKWLPTYGLWFLLKSDREENAMRLPIEGRLDPIGMQRLEWLHTPKKRGTEKIRIAGIVSKFPFGFLRKSINDSYEKQAVVWPQRISYQWRRTSNRQAARPGSGRGRIGQGPELVNLRAYRPGDPMRSVLWKASAKQRRLLVRESAEENRGVYSLIVTPSANIWQRPEAFESMCSLAATLAEDLFISDRLGAVSIGSNGIRTIRRLGDLHEFLNQLAVIEPSTEKFPQVDTRPFIPITFRPTSETRAGFFIHGTIEGEA